MADIFKEVDEELRRENYAKLWKKYGRAVIAGAAAIVLGVAAVQAWRAYDLSHRGDLSDRYAAALDLAAAGKPGASLAAFSDLSESSETGYPGLSAFEKARLLVQGGDVDGAVAIWDQIAGNSAMGGGFRNVAALLSVHYQIETGDPAALAARLAPLSADGQPFRASALELQAMLELRQGDRDRAREIFTALVDDRSTPSGLRARAAQMLAVLEN